MSIIETIKISNPRIVFTGHGQIDWVDSDTQRILEVPQLFFRDGEPFRAVNKYAIEYRKSHPSDAQLKTLKIKMIHIKAFTDFLEDKGLDWRHFPRKKYESVLFRFRQFLIGQRDNNSIAPSTTSVRMNAVLNFYQWAQVHSLIEKNLWEKKQVSIRFYTSVGFARTMHVASSELAIPNRSRRDYGMFVEEGLVPISIISVQTLLQYLKEQRNIELELMIVIGLATGARSETIRTLTKTSVQDAIISSTKAFFIPVGPGTQIKTKYGVNGYVQLPHFLHERLLSYSNSEHRALRSNKAKDENKDNLFLTKTGVPYSQSTLQKLMVDLRSSLIRLGCDEFNNFHFHQTRATAITERMRVALRVFENDIASAVTMVRDFALHKDETTTWKYVKFINHTPISEALNKEFCQLMFGNRQLDEKDFSISGGTYL